MITLDTLLAYMRSRGQSVTLNWGEDNNLWECSWVTGGKRYTGFGDTPINATHETMMKTPDTRAALKALFDRAG